MAGNVQTAECGLPDYLYVASDRQLRRKDHQVWIARYLVDLRTRMPRRARPEYVIDTLEAARDRLRNRDLTPFAMDDRFIDAVFGEDGSCRWWDDFCVFAYREPAQRPQGRILPRLRGIDACARLEGWNPDAFTQGSALVSPITGEARP